LLTQVDKIEKMPHNKSGHQEFEKHFEELISTENAEKDVEKLDYFFNTCPYLLIVTNPQGEIFKINKSCKTILEYSHKEILNIDLWTLVHPDDIEKTNKVIESQSKGREIPRLINRYKNKKGSYRTLEWQASAVLNGFTYAFAKDITARTEALEELAFQKQEKEKWADELVIANKELAYQNQEKEKRADELVIANKELAYQNQEKEKRAQELIVANKELAYQNQEKEKRADELVIANKELAYQNQEKEKRAQELVVANKELAHQNQEKEKRADELVIANKELAYQNQEKEKRADELGIANEELEQFSYIASHDLQEPLRTVTNYIKVFEEDYNHLLDDTAREYLLSMKTATDRMRSLIKSLLEFSRLGLKRNFELVDCKELLADVIADLDGLIRASGAIIEISEMPRINLSEIEIRELFQNLITNAIKFQKKGNQPKILIRSEETDKSWKFCVSDNGIGIDSVYFERIFDIFQRLHTTDDYEGTGIGLANCKKIVQLHKGEIWLESTIGLGTSFYFTVHK
jgi:PAS domain S-box-containing protein